MELTLRHDSARATSLRAMADQDAPLVADATLNTRQTAFVTEYLVDLNGTQAAIRAGYSSNGANVTAVRLLSDPTIADAVERAKAQRSARVNVQQDSVLHEMSLLANSRIDHYLIDDAGNIELAAGAPEGALAAIKSKKSKKTVREDKDGNMTVTYEVDIQLWDKPGTLKLMGRHIGLFPDKVELSGPNGKPVETITRVENVIIDRVAEPS